MDLKHEGPLDAYLEYQESFIIEVIPSRVKEVGVMHASVKFWSLLDNGDCRYQIKQPTYDIRLRSKADSEAIQRSKVDGYELCYVEIRGEYITITDRDLSER